MLEFNLDEKGTSTQVVEEVNGYLEYLYIVPELANTEVIMRVDSMQEINLLDVYANLPTLIFLRAQPQESTGKFLTFGTTQFFFSEEVVEFVIRGSPGTRIKLVLVWSEA